MMTHKHTLKYAAKYQINVSLNTWLNANMSCVFAASRALTKRQVILNDWPYLLLY